MSRSDTSEPLLDIMSEQCDVAAEGGTSDSQSTVAFANVVIMAATFFFMFAAYNTLQSYLSTTLPANFGFKSLIVIYIFYFLCIPIAPAFCARANDRHVMILGALAYSLFTASLIVGIQWAILLASAILGFGAALLWVAQGSFLTACSCQHNRGRYAGIFWMGFQLSAIGGPLASFVILSHFREDKSKGNLVMYIVFSLCCVVATLLLCFLRPVENDAAAKAQNKHTQAHNNASMHLDVDSIDGVKSPTFCSEIITSVRNIITATGDRDIKLLLVGCAWTGLEVAFSNGEFFKLVGDGKDESVISLVFIAFGLADSAGGVLLGRLSDHLEQRQLPGRKAVVVFGCLCFITALALTVVLKHHPNIPPLLPSPRNPHRSAPLLAYITAMLFGLGDAAFNTQLFALLGALYPDAGEVAFAVFQLCQQVVGPNKQRNSDIDNW